MLLQVEGAMLSAVGAAYTPVTSGLNVYDALNNNWTGATISFTNNYQNGQDVLSFTNTANISGSWNAATGTLTLIGTDSVSNYRSALRSVTYHNTSASPNTALTRSITFQTLAGAVPSNTVTRNLTVRGTFNPPTISGLGATGTYVDPSSPLVIAPNIVVTEPDRLNILNATVSFTNWQGEDRVAFYNSLALQHTFTEDLVAHTATLTIAGSATAAGYQTLLQSVTYQDVAGQPVTSAARVATITVNDQYHSASTSTSISVTQYLSGLAASVNYVQGTSPLTLFPNLVVAPPAGLTVQSATVSFTNWQPEDRLAFSNTLALQHTFAEDFVAHTATLTITGTATGTGVSTATRTFTVIATDTTNVPSTLVTRTMTVTP